ncbi:MAG TPA: methyltransferase domain-containing protein [Vicinamibacterales bacterium]|nr:methyltransferase domain-containing protein [Vicinamibacterales bacterium]
MSASIPDQMPDAWGAIAPGYEKVFEKLSSQFAEAALALLKLRPGERVIDVAAGTGAFSLAAARAGAAVLATDFAPAMVARLRQRVVAERLSGISAEVMDGQALDVPDGSFDASVSILGLIFFPDICRGMTELRRVLRPGGRAAIVCWGDPANFQLMTLMMRAVQQTVPDFQPPAAVPVWARLCGPASLKDQLQQAGFRQVEITTVTRSLRVDSPEAFWTDFASSVPPLADLFRRLGPDRTAAVGRTVVELLAASAGDGVPTLSAEACIGIGRT